MNTFDNYKELKTSIVDWVDRQDIEDKIPGFVRLVTIDVSRDLRIPTMVTSTVTDMYADGSVLIPPDLIEVKSLNVIELNEYKNITAIHSLDRASIYEYERSRKDNYGIENTPTRFATSRNKFYVFPLNFCSDTLVDNSVVNENVVGKVEVTYYRLPVTINEDDEYNWILEISPEIYFYGCLMHTYRYIRDLDNANFWEDKYNKAVNKLQGSVDISEWAGGPITVD